MEDYTSLVNSEVEDIVPYDLLQRPIDRLFNNVDLDFSSTYDSAKPIIPQIEQFAVDNNIELPEGYKVELARQFKQILIARSDKYADATVIDMWANIFNKILGKS